MSDRVYSASLYPVRGHDAPPADFADVVIDTCIALPAEVFSSNLNRDIYSILAPVLGPWDALNELNHRKAAMINALLVDAQFESDCTWTEGADTTAGYETPEEQETGAWQVSANSMGFDPSLRNLVGAVLTSTDPHDFVNGMKCYHALAVEYAARLFRLNTRWSGPCNRGWIAANVRREAVEEIVGFLSSTS